MGKIDLTGPREFFRTGILFFLVLCSLEISAQEADISEMISSIAEELAGDETDPDAVEEFADKLHDLAEKPVKLNSADESELSRLFFLTDFQVKSLKEYIETSGPIVSVYEIANIPGFNRHLAAMMLPFSTPGTAESKNSGPSGIRSNLLSNFTVSYPFSLERQPGPPWKMLIRYRFNAGRLSGGFSAEKDPGEKLMYGNPPLPDFLSGYLAFSGSGIIRRVVVGDFSARFGMGTGVNSGLRTGLSLTQTGYMAGKDEVKPYTSTDENLFFRGIAAQMKIRRAGIALFLSANSLDANIDTSENSKSVFIRTFNRSGIHNSAPTIAIRDAVEEYCYGANFSLDFNKTEFGILWTGSRFTLPVKPDETDPAEIFDFDGEKNLTATAYYRAVVNKMILYGEVSSNLNRRSAFVQGLTLRPSDRLTINILYRNYQPGYTGFHGKGIFSGSAGNNVRGLFGNFSFEAARHLFISAGCDIFQHPWLKYRCSAPSVGINRDIRIRYLPSGMLAFETGYSYHVSVSDSEGTTGLEKQVEKSSRYLKAVFKYLPLENLSIITRIDYKISGSGPEKGMLLLQDINYRFRNVPVSLWFRYCIFKTGGWDTRLYTYENDLYRSFYIPALSGEGNRSYIMIDWQALRFMDVRFKFAFTSVKQETGIYAEKHEIKFQARIWF